MKFPVILVALLLTAHSALAKPLSTNDFAKGYDLQLEQRGAIHYLSLPQEVYTTAVQPSLSDLRVFNSQGQTVPHLIKMETPEPSQITSEINLPLSPLYNIVRTGTVRYVEVQMMKEKKGAGQGLISGFTQTERNKTEESEKMNGYLIETEAIANAPYRLQFDLISENDLMAPLNIDASNDLTTWTPIGTETLVRLNYQGHLIKKNFDFLVHHKNKYLRLSWPAGQQEIIIDKIRALSVTGAKPQVREWATMKGKRLEGENVPNTIILEFDSQGFLPVDTARIDFPDQNTLIQATLKSRPDLNSPWRKQGGGMFYRIAADGNILRDDTISIQRTTDRYWRLEISSDQDASPDSLPNLQLGWTPHTLYFMSQGPDPYLLAFGNGALPTDINSAGNVLASLLTDPEKRNSIIAPAKIQRNIELGGPDKLLPPPPTAPWKKWLLWTILVSGVLMIGAMALSLYRQMNERQQKDAL